MFGMSGKKLMIYGTLLVLLVLANLWAFRQNDGPVVSQTRPELQNVADLPDIFVASDLRGFATDTGRDLFREKAPEPPKPVEPEPEPPKPAEPDPKAQLLAEVRKTLDSIDVLGILGANDGPVAILQIGGEIISVSQGDVVLPGYSVRSLALDYVELGHSESGETRVYLMGTSGN